LKRKGVWGLAPKRGSGRQPRNKASPIESSTLYRFHFSGGVNSGMAERLRAGLSRDALVNGLIILDTFANPVPYVTDRSLAEIRYIFSE